MIVYLTKQGSSVQRESRTLRVMREDGSDVLFPEKVQQILAFGNISFSPQAIAMAFSHEIDVVFLSSTGRYRGRLGLGPPKNVFLRRRQYERSGDNDFQQACTRSIVAGKVQNQRTLLLRLGRSRSSHVARAAAQALEILLNSINSSFEIATLRGYEGKAATHYFSGFASGFIKDIGFRKRIRRPPTDPVNSVLSLLYTLLMNRVYAAVALAGLDPFWGNLHALDYGRFSLVLDLMEEWRPIIADSLTLSLFNLGVLGRDNFIVQQDEDVEEAVSGKQESASVAVDTSVARVVRDSIGAMSPVVEDQDGTVADLPEQRLADELERGEDRNEGKRPVILTPEALKKVLQVFEEKLATEFFFPPLNKRVSFDEAIRHQARHYRAVVEGNNDIYVPVKFR